jgi:glycerophosphoryl diester phosphodiesterase
MIDGEEVTGWFTEDFTLAELRTLRARERLPQIRPANTAFDGLWQVPTLAEIIALVRAVRPSRADDRHLYPEIKHPAYFSSIGHDLAAMLVEELHAAGYRTPSDPVFIQSFEATPLQRLDTMTDLRLVQLVSADGGPADLPDMTYADMLTPQGLAGIAAYADGIGAELRLLLDEQGSGTGLVDAAHAAGLVVHGWTLRKENAFMPPRHRSSDVRLHLVGCFPYYWDEIAATGIDGVFTDDPVYARNSRDRGPDAIINCHRYIDPPAGG